MKRTTWLLALVVLPALVACNEARDAVREKTRTVEVVPAQVEPPETEHVFAGRVLSAVRTPLAFRVNGPVKELAAAAGDRVEAGDLLARMDPRDYERRVSELEALLAQAASQRRLAEIEYRRTRDAADGPGVSPQELDQAEASMQQAQARVEAVNAKLDSAHDALEDTELRAPAHGTVARRLVDRDTQVAAGETVFEFHAEGDRQVEVQVPDRHIARLDRGADAWLGFPGHGSARMPAVSLEIAAAPSGGAGSYAVRLAPREAGDLPPVGAPARAGLRVPSIWPEGAVRVPVTAVIGPGNAGRYLFVVTDEDVARRVEVEVLGGADAMFVVRGDLAPDARVVSAGAEFLVDGTPVRVRGAGLR